jgi:hypothetical protein
MSGVTTEIVVTLTILGVGIVIHQLLRLRRWLNVGGHEKRLTGGRIIARWWS